MKGSRVVGRLSVFLGLTVLLALQARASGQEGAGSRPGPQSKEASSAAARESVQAIIDEYDRQVVELDRRRLDQLTRLAARQVPAAAAATYEQLFRLAIDGNQFREAEAGATAVVKSGSPSPTTAALAYLVKMIAAADRGAHEESLATLREGLEKSEKSGAPAALLTSEIVGICDAYYQHLVQTDQFEVARKAFRLALEHVQSPVLREFLAGRLKRLDLVGKPAPAIRGKDLDGKPFDLAETKGKVVLVEFWATWCLPSADEVEWLKQTEDAYLSRGFRVVGINVDTLRDGGEKLEKVLPEIRRFLLDHNVVWPTLVNGTGDADYARAFGVTEIPANVLIGKDGTVTHIDQVRDALVTSVDKELGR